MLLTDSSTMNIPRGSAQDFYELLKPRVMSLVVFTGVAGMIAAPGSLHPLLAFMAILCLALGAGSAGAFNMFWERESDKLMTRTKNRPLPQGRIDASEAIAFSLFFSGFSVIFMGLSVGWLAAGLLAFAIFFYNVVYTIFLKPHTPHNIVIGGLAGAMPPLIGWCAVSGEISLTPLLLVLVIFFWTPPHFWALALYKDHEYAKAGIPMYPVIHGRQKTLQQMFIHGVVMVGLSVLAYVYGSLGQLYLLTALITGGVFLTLLIRLMIKPSPARAFYFFKATIFYLFTLFGSIILESLLKGGGYAIF